MKLEHTIGFIIILLLALDVYISYLHLQQGIPMHGRY
jgi:hypothetical protein